MAKRGLSLRQKVKLSNEYRALRKQLKKEHPDWSLAECAAEAKEQMEAKYEGLQDWDWEAIKEFLTFLFELLMPLLLAGADSDTV